jgi:hypothetical protein
MNPKFNIILRQAFWYSKQLDEFLRKEFLEHKILFLSTKISCYLFNVV